LTGAACEAAGHLHSQSLLRHAQAVSRISDLSSGVSLRSWTTAADPAASRACFARKICYDFAAAREGVRRTTWPSSASSSYPFPAGLGGYLGTRGGRGRLGQEEPKNMGVSRYMRGRNRC
jgi:hypothetical protein